MINFKYSYSGLPNELYETIQFRQFANPLVILLNNELLLDLNLNWKIENDLGHLLSSGFSTSISTKPIAFGYAGHQFGHYVPQLGDGRALLVGEFTDKQGRIFDLHLKGSGATKYSRQGDGKATLGATIKEYIVSEALFHLGIPSTRPLAITLTGETIQREESFPGAVLARVTQSHIRVGTFQYAQHFSKETLKALADYTIKRHYPDLIDVNENKKYQLFYEKVVRKQKDLIIQWMSMGFIHGVMNTDNMTIAGQTIDFGPCAFMDQFDPEAVFSFIDRHGRYAYNNQPAIAQWNLKQLGVSLKELLSVSGIKEAEAFIQNQLNNFSKEFSNDFKKRSLMKMGLIGGENDEEILQDFHQLMYRYRADYTLSFRSLSKILKNETPYSQSVLAIEKDDVKMWIRKWVNRVSELGLKLEVANQLELINPIYIPRNHLVEKAIQEVLRHNNYTFLTELNSVLKTPYHLSKNHLDWINPARPEEQVQYTYCGT